MRITFGKQTFPKDQLIILDTTLRDGIQSPGANIKLPERLQIAEALHDLGVNVLEVGFPVSSPDNFKATQLIANDIGTRPNAPTISSFSRTGRWTETGEWDAKDIDAAWEAVKGATHPRIHIVGTGSDLHLKYKYKNEGADGRTREKNLDVIRQSIQHAKKLMEASNKTIDIEFSPEDCGRADKDYLVKIFDTAIKAGATTVNLPDTIGWLLPEEYGQMFNYVKQRVPNADSVIWSTHTHNDLGFAAANAMAGIQNGARQIEVTVNGIGERAGNAALEQLTAAVHYKPNLFQHLKTTLKLDKLFPVSQLVSQLTRMAVQPNSPLVGKNSFRHKSGMHQDGVLKNPDVYQALDNKLFGREIEFELGPDSGRAGLFTTVKRLGYEVPENKKAVFFDQFKSLADQVGLVEDSHLLALIRKCDYLKPVSK